MATTTVSFSVRTDPALKKQVDLFLKNVGMSMSTAINLYLRKIVMEQRIPFEISAASPNAGLQAFHALRSQAKDNGAQGMTLRAINREIAASRKRK